MTNIIQAVSDNIDYIKEEIHAEFHRFETGGTQMTHQAIDVFKQKWLKESVSVEQKIMAAKLTPQSQALVPELESMLQELRTYIEHYLELLKTRYQATGAPPMTDTESEKERKRRERKERMARYQRGEKPL